MTSQQENNVCWTVNSRLENRYHYTAWQPIYSEETLLADAYNDMQNYVTAVQADIPWIVQLVENPKYRFFRFGLLQGATSLFVHDLLHIILQKDMKMAGEAYVIGFTMGSTKKSTKVDSWLFRLFSKYLYPKEFRFNNKQLAIFNQGVQDGLTSTSNDLHRINPEELFGRSLTDIRTFLKVPV